MRNKVVQFHKPRKLKFIKDILKEECVDSQTGEVTVNHRVLIRLKNLENGRSRIHPFTEFINQWINHSIKHQSNIATHIVRFLNFIYFEISDSVISDISELTFEYGVLFLNKQAKVCSRDVVSQYERSLSHFYFFLAERKIMKFISLEEFKFIEKNYRLILQSPFKGVRKGEERHKDLLHCINFELVFTFIEIALREEPAIALGVYFQIFGGLRASEVITIEYNNLSLKGPNGRDGMTVNLFTKDLRPDLKSGFINGVKRKRKQKIIGMNGVLSTLYCLHRDNFKKEGCNAVFIDKKGNPMTYSTYWRRFTKVKQAFINELSNSEDLNLKAYALTLRSYDWSTHIGRGIFSNMTSEVAGNAAEIAVMRGDKNLNSSIVYITDTSVTEKKVVSLMEKFYEDLEVFKNGVNE